MFEAGRLQGFLEWVFLCQVNVVPQNSNMLGISEQSGLSVEDAPAGAVFPDHPAADTQGGESLLLWPTSSNHAKEPGQVIIYFWEICQIKRRYTEELRHLC